MRDRCSACGITALEHDLSAGVAGFAQLLRFAGFRQWQHRFDVHFDFSIYDQAGNRGQLLAVRLLADEKSFGFRSLVFGRS
jgi:hypothetical protein